MELQMRTSASRHILAIPYPLMGHITPVVQLCRLLIGKQQEGSCRVTIIIPERDAPSLLKLLPSHRPHIDILPLSDGLPLDLGPPNWDTSRSLVDSRHSPLSGLARSTALHIARLRNISCIISDVYLGWTQAIANSLGVPRIAVWVAGICEFQVYIYAQELINSGKLPFQAPKGQEKGPDNMIPQRGGRPPVYHRVDEAYVEETIEIPGLPSLSRGDLPVFLQIEDPTDIYFYNWVDQVKSAFEASMVLFNSFNALEGNLIELLKGQGIPVHTIGPLFLLEDAILKREDAEVKRENGKPSEEQWKDSMVEEEPKEAPNECLQWLDKQKPRSVLYVAFGTAVHLTKTQVYELALGLQSSGQPFIWAHRQYCKGKEEEEGFPKGFLDNIVNKGKGRVVQWAPQRRILEHIAIGGFLSHCGWNSTIEAICYGVPTIGLPFVSDQTLHCKMMVEVWKMGLRLHRDAASGVALAHEIAVVINEILLSEKGAKLRERAEELKVAADNSIQAGGSSLSTLNALVKLIS